MEPAPIPGRWFDGKRSRAQPVLVVVRPGAGGPTLTLHPLEAEGGPVLSLGHAEIDWPESWNKVPAATPLVVDLHDCGSLEVSDARAWQQATRAAGLRPRLAQRLQTRWPAFLGVLALAAAGLYLFYRFATPWAATQLTRQVPIAWEISVAAEALQDLDKHYLQPSRLPASRQAQLRSGFEGLAREVDRSLQRYADYRPPLVLHFRAGMKEPNALALPGGTIVLMDSLVEAAERAGLGDDALLGVLAHEIGHVVHRHGTRMVVEQAVLNVGFGLAMGDLSGLLSVASSLVTGAAYQRSHEREADCFALALMAKANKPSGPMADLLLKLDPEPPPEGDSARAAGDSWTSLASTHPGSAERARRMKAGNTDGC